MIVNLPFLPWDLEIQIRFRNKGMQSYRVSFNRTSYNKVFCIGFNKTGTTSLENLLSMFGFRTGNQPVGEILSLDWLVNRNAERIIKYCHTADAFQDAPFSFPGLYKVLDNAFPNSKFILTVRNNPEEWFNSLIKFHTNFFSSDKSRPPTDEDLRNATYRYKGYALEIFKYLHGYPEIPLYDEEIYKKQYILDNDEKRTYFKNRPANFIEINLSNKKDFQRLCDFLEVKTVVDGFPWLNRSDDTN